MFDALILRPQIPVVMIMSCLAIAIGWILLLRKFARTVVYVSELVKVAALIYIGVKSENAFFFVCAGGYVAYAVYIRKKLDFAARIIKHSSNGLKENPAMFFALLAVKAIYVIQAILYVKFFEWSTEIKQVEENVSSQYVDYQCSLNKMDDEDPSKDVYYSCYDFNGTNDCVVKGGTCSTNDTPYITTCEIVEPSWVGSGRWYIMFFWLWSVMFYNQWRLVIIANVIGSWHFHPQDKPTPAEALSVSAKNSLGTISISSLICAIVDQLQRQMKPKVRGGGSSDAIFPWFLYSP